MTCRASAQAAQVFGTHTTQQASASNALRKLWEEHGDGTQFPGDVHQLSAGDGSPEP